MPQADDDVTAAGAYQLPAGSYARLLREKCEMRAHIEYVYNNPRCSALLDDWRAAAIEREKAEKLAAAAARQMFAELLAEPIVVQQGQARGGRPMPGMPVWLAMSSAAHGGASEIRIYRDNVCEPAAFRGERSPNGVGFESICVPPRHQVQP